MFYGMPVTVTGMLVSVMVPLPSCPEPLSPQCLTVPPEMTAHAWLWPEEMATAPRLTHATGKPTAPSGVAGLDGVDGPEVEGLALVAVTVNVYGVPFVRPVTVQVSVGAVAVQFRPPGLAVAVYEAIAAPPFAVGAVHDTAT